MENSMQCVCALTENIETEYFSLHVREKAKHIDAKLE